eukprot:5623650-Prymnesium_polylepis.3
MDDIKLATNAKARAKFLDAGWQGCQVVELTGSADSEAEAAAYDAELRKFSADVLPVEDGLPIFDMMLVGVGDDGHIGSLYPGRDVYHNPGSNPRLHGSAFWRLRPSC